MHSPKNKFHAVATFSKYIPGVGSVISAGAMSLEDTQSLIQSLVEGQQCKKNEAHIVIKENEATYPYFDWHIVKEYNARK